MANEYKAWYRRNDPQNAREGWDAYNRPFGERYERPSEYQDVRGDAYHHFPERYDITADQDKKRLQPDEEKQQDMSRQAQRARTARAGQTAVKSVVQSIAGTCVAVVVGAVVLVSGYQAIEAEKAAETAAAIVETVDWAWSEDNEVVTASLINEDGSVITELPAVVTVAVEEATCTADGRKTYTATVEYNEETYTNVRYDMLPATGHTFDEGKVVITENGPPMIEIECTHCHKKFTVTATIDENDE